MRRPEVAGLKPLDARRACQPGLTRTHGRPRPTVVMQGLSEGAKGLCVPVSIPLAGGMESLNVGVAGGILLYLLTASRAGQHDEQQPLATQPRRRNTTMPLP